MPTPYEAPCLRALRIALDNRWPNRDRRSDGWIGDAAHAATKSDHNPDPVTGCVRARDIDADGVHVPTVLASLFLHPSTTYVIHRRRIYSRRRAFMPAAYDGVNAHLGHVHESVAAGVAETRTDPWRLIATVPNWGAGLKVGADGSKAGECQAYLIAHGFPVPLDHDYGPRTAGAVERFQRAHGLRPDGIAGPHTLAKMRTA